MAIKIAPNLPGPQPTTCRTGQLSISEQVPVNP
jgi:hypothetical protein